MPERLARIAALILLVVLILALPLLISLFGALNAPAPTATIPSAALASPTFVPPTNTSPPPSATHTPTLNPSPFPTPGCGIPATPEPLWVNPLLSPTNLLSQKISVTLGRGREIVITTEAGTFAQRGEFSIARPVEIEITLVPNTTNHLLVTGQVEYEPNCFYTLQTRLDRVGNPLVIVQASNLTSPPPTFVPTPPAPGTVYLKPFAQVFALNQDTPNPTGQLYLYETDTVDAFQVLAQEGAFTHLLSQGGTLHFWTLNDNVTAAPAPFPQYDNSKAGTRVEFVSDMIFACEAQYPRPLILGLCAQISSAGGGEVIQRAQAESAALYEVRLNNRIYWVSANALIQEP